MCQILKKKQWWERGENEEEEGDCRHAMLFLKQDAVQCFHQGVKLGRKSEVF
jgi:hypothetical protein